MINANLKKFGCTCEEETVITISKTSLSERILPEVASVQGKLGVKEPQPRHLPNNPRISHTHLLTVYI